jgi:hypothetical protein
MATVEEQLKQLAKDVKTIGVEQINGTQHLKELVEWKQTTSRTAADLQTSIDDLTSRIQALEATFFKPPLVVPLREEEGRAIGHDKDIIHQGVDPGSSAPGSTLVNGEHSYTKLSAAHIEIHDPGSRKTYLGCTPKEFMLPKTEFPKFNGEDPRIWKDKAEKYFSMYGVPTHVWASFATHNFRGNASRWLQAYEARHTVDTWVELCVAVKQKFGRELYQNHMCDILDIRQTGDVLEYANRFDEAKHRVLVHNRDLDEVFFVQNFWMG